MPETAVEQMRDAIEDGIVVFTPPWLGEVLLELVERVEALEGQSPTSEALIADARSMSAAIRAKTDALAEITQRAPDWQISDLLLVLADALEARAGWGERALTWPDHVQGFCPMGCGRTLFLGHSGYVTCGWLECPDPSAASDLLSKPRPSSPARQDLTPEPATPSSGAIGLER